MLPNTRSYVGRRVAATFIDYTLVLNLGYLIKRYLHHKYPPKEKGEK